MNNKKKHFFSWLLINIALIGGCNQQNSTGNGSTSSPAVRESSGTNGDGTPLTRVNAVGRLEPAGGVIPIVAKPGDRIVRIDVIVGNPYPQGTEVATLAGTALLDAEVTVAELQLTEASAQKDAELNAADAKLAVVDQAIEANRLKLQEAQERLNSARSKGGEFELLDSKVELAEDALKKLEQAASPGPNGRSLATQSQLKQQELADKAAQYERTSAQRELENGVKVAQMLLASSEKERAAAEATKLAAAAAVPLDSAQQKIELLKQQVAASKPRMPISGVVLSIDASVGQPTSTMPIMQVADLNSMICRAEVYVEDRRLINPGDRAIIKGGGLESDITGEVIEISMLVGAPKMTSLNPMDPVDYRMAPVLIKIDDIHLEAARKLVNTQVKVEIDLNNPTVGKPKNSVTSN